MSSVVTALKNDPTISAIVADRIFPNIVPQGENYPAITYSKTYGSPEYCQKGISQSEENIQFMVGCQKFVDVVTVTNRIKQLLKDFKTSDVDYVRLEREGLSDYFSEVKAHVQFIEFRFFTN